MILTKSPICLHEPAGPTPWSVLRFFRRSSSRIPRSPLIPALRAPLGLSHACHPGKQFLSIGAACVVITALVLNGSAQVSGEVICDGGFESPPANNGNISPVPYSYGIWGIHIIQDANVGLVSSPAHGGSTALQVDTRFANHGGYAYQDITNLGTSFTWRFFIQQGQGVNVAALESDWDRTAGDAHNVTVLRFSSTGILFTAWNASANLEVVLGSGSWHEIVVQADGNRRSQDLFVDGRKVGHLESPGDLYGVGVILLGDTSGAAEHGLYGYDDVSLIPPGSPGMDLAVVMDATPITVVPGQQVTFGLSVSNKGNMSASEVVLTNVLPNNATFVSASSSQGSCTQSLGTVVCSLGGIDAGSSATVNIVATIPAAGTATSIANVVAYEPDLNLADNAASAAVTVVEGPLSEIHLYPGITVCGMVGRTYGIQYTADLINWFGLTNITLTAPSQIWYDSQPATLPRRFYRVVVGPISVP